MQLNDFTGCPHSHNSRYTYRVHSRLEKNIFFWKSYLYTRVNNVPENREHFGHLPDSADLVFDHFLALCSCVGCKGTCIRSLKAFWIRDGVIKLHSAWKTSLKPLDTKNVLLIICHLIIMCDIIIGSRSLSYFTASFLKFSKHFLASVHINMLKPFEFMWCFLFFFAG